MEALVRRGEFLEAIAEAKQLLMLPLTPREKGQVYRLMGRARGESGDQFGALKPLELAIPLALRAKDWDSLGKARAELGISWLKVGDTSNAVEYLESYVLDLIRYDSARAYLGSVHYNLGLAYRYRRDYTRAITHYQAAVEWFSERGYTQQSGETHQNLAWLYCLQGDSESARIEIDIAESFADVCGAEFMVEQLLCRAFLHMVDKQIWQAMKLVQEVLKPGRPGCTTSQKAHACWIAGRCALAACNFDTAHAFAEFTVKHALKAEDTAAMSLGTHLKAEVARRQRGSDEAVG